MENSAYFENNDVDLYLENNAFRFQINSTYPRELKIDTAKVFGNGNSIYVGIYKDQKVPSEKFIISKKLNTKISYSSYKIYITKHTHNWSYSLDEDKQSLSAKCIADGNCEYYDKNMSVNIYAKIQRIMQ